MSICPSRSPLTCPAQKVSGSESLVKAFKDHNFDCLNIGEYGISILERQNGISLTPDRYGVCEKGFWIRGLFKKAG